MPRIINDKKNNQISIRDMQINDIMHAKEIEKLAYLYNKPEINFYDELRNSYACYFVAIKKQKMIGFAGIWIFPDEAHIAQIAVLPLMQKKKVGSLLLNKCTELAKEYKINKLHLEVHENNDSAITFYKKDGFIIIDKKRDYYKNKSNTNNALIMEKKLS